MAFNNLGNALRNAGKYEEAIGSYHKSIEVDHNYHYPYGNLKTVLIEKVKSRAKVTMSIAFLQSILGKHPDCQRAKDTIKALTCDIHRLYK
jgi:tetratricopeptide (TPR) repeat protein